MPRMLFVGVSKFQLRFIASADFGLFICNSLHQEKPASPSDDSSDSGILQNAEANLITEGPDDLPPDATTLGNQISGFPEV